MKEYPKWTRNCPKCNKILEYKSESRLKDSLKKTGLCRKCYMSEWSRFTGKKHSPEYVSLRSEMMRTVWNPTKGKKHTKKTIQKIKEKRAQQIISEETRIKISLANKGKIVSDATRKKMSESFRGRKVSEETRALLSKSHKQRFQSMSVAQYREYCKQRRLASIKYWQTKHSVYPNYNPNSIKILEQKAEELGIKDLQHAENGGEFFIKELGYWVDGYSKEKNIVIEFYEPFHQNQSDRDLRRENEIKDFLGCEFIIIHSKS